MKLLKSVRQIFNILADKIPQGLNIVVDLYVFIYMLSLSLYNYHENNYHDPPPSSYLVELSQYNYRVSVRVGIEAFWR